MAYPVGDAHLSQRPADLRVVDLGHVPYVQRRFGTSALKHPLGNMFRHPRQWQLVASVVAKDDADRLDGPFGVLALVKGAQERPKMRA